MATSVSPRWDLAEAVENCEYGNSDEVTNLITNRYTPLYYEDDVLTKMYMDPMTWTGAILDRWPREVFNYGQGSIPYREIYHPAFVPRGIQNFQNDNTPIPAEVSNPADGAFSNCVFCYIDIPTGGRSTVRAKFVRRDYRTAPICVRDIQSSRNYWEYTDRLLSDRMAAEQTTMVDFFNLVAHETSGYKVLLESDHPDTTALNPRQLLPQYPNTYLEEQAPAIYNPNNIQPLTLSILLQLAQRMSQDYTFRNTAVGLSERGPLYKLEVSDDWYMYNQILNPQWSENFRWSAPQTLFKGFNPNRLQYPGQQEVIQNWLIFQNNFMPRYTINTVDGGLVEVQPFTTVTSEAGVEAVLNPAWINAPFGVARISSPTQAKVLTQPGITNSQGIAIPNVQGVNWEPWNEYDPICNPEKLLPYWKFHFRMGFMPVEPWTAIEIIYRRQEIIYPETPACNLYPIVCATVTPETCEALNGDCSQRSPVPGSITKTKQSTEVLYTHVTCGSTRYVEVRVPFLSGRRNQLSCACGSSVRIQYSDDTFDQGVVLNNYWSTPANPYDTYLIDLGSGNSVPAGECITDISCLDGTPLVANILVCVGEDICEELEAGQIYIFTDQPLMPDGTPVYTITGSDGVTNIVVTVVEADPTNNKYLVSAVGLDCADAGGIAGGIITTS